MTTTLRFHRLLLTGAAGHLGRVLRPRLKSLCTELRLSDVATMDPAGPGEDLRPADLADHRLARQCLDGLDELTRILGLGDIYDFQLA